MGLFGPSKGKGELVDLSRVQQIIEEQHLINFISMGGNAPTIFADGSSSFNISVNNGYVKMSNRSVAFEFGDDYAGATIAIPKGSKIFFYAKAGQVKSERATKNIKMGKAGQPGASGQNGFTSAGTAGNVRERYSDAGQGEEAPTSTSEPNQMKSFDFSEIRKIVISADIANVEIIASGTSIGYARSQGTVSGGKYFFDAKVEGDTLKVTQKLTGTAKNVDITVTVAIPWKDYQYIEAHTASGDVSFDANLAYFLDGNFATNSGDISILLPFESFPAKGERLRVRTDSGDIEVSSKGQRGIQQFGLIDAHTISGDLNLRFGYADEVRCQNTSGDINVSGGITQITANTTSGDIDVSQYYAYEGGAELSTVSGDVHYHPSNIRELVLNTRGELSGCRYKKAQLGFRGQADISTVSGEIIVD